MSFPHPTRVSIPFAAALGEVWGQTVCGSMWRQSETWKAAPKSL